MEAAFAQPDRAVDVETLVLAVLVAKDASGKVLALPEELANPSAFLFATQVLRPAVEAALPDSWNGLLGLASRVDLNAASAAAGNVNEELTKVRETIRSLETEAKNQKATIADLKRRLDNR